MSVMAKRYRWGASAVLLGLSMAASAGELHVDKSASKIQVMVRATGDDFVAGLDAYEARIGMSEQTGQPESARVEWNFTDLKTGNAKRDKAMLKWLECDRFARASFTLTDWRAEEGRNLAVGRLVMHGSTNQVTMPVTVERHDDRVSLRGSADFDHRDWGLDVYTMLLFLKVDPHLHVDFDVEGTLSR